MTESTLYPTQVEFGSLDEIRDTALATMSAELVDYLEGGAGRETTLAANTAAFSRHRILPVPMSGVARPDTAAKLLDLELAVPVLTAPFGGDGLFHPDGHLAVASAAAEIGALAIVPEAGTFSYERVRQASPTSARIAQLHPFPSAPEVAERVADAGYAALCVTVDCAIGGFRTRNMRNRFSPDLAAFSGNLVRGDRPGPAVAEVMGQLVNGGTVPWNWSDLEIAARRFRVPWIAKGVLTPAAARRAIEAGASGVVVSNHGARQVDPAPTSVEALPAVRQALGPDVPILLDSGVRSGADVYIALALGADAVILGRSAIYGLAAGGAAGVRRVLELVAEELRTLMMLSGAASLSAISPECLLAAPQCGGCR